MNYEQKYNEALERASKLIVQNPFDTVSQMMEHVFPELKESEDERIKKEIIDAIQGLYDYDELPLPLTVKRKDEWIAWLEKNGKGGEFVKVNEAGLVDIEKIAAWLNTNISSYMNIENEEDDGIIYVFNKRRLIEDLTKTMEGGKE